MVNFTDFDNKNEWLAGRKNGLGASEVASALGMGFVSQLDLWKSKVGIKELPNIDENDRVRYGQDAEEYLRQLFALQYKKDYDVSYFRYRVYRNDKNPMFTCTLDGELVEKETQKKGILEIKTTWITSKQDLSEWEGNHIPQKYYIQTLSQLFVTEFDFVILFAQLIMSNGNSELRHYRIDKEEVRDDIEYIAKEGAKFWVYVETRQAPPTKIIL